VSGEAQNDDLDGKIQERFGNVIRTWIVYCACAVVEKGLPPGEVCVD